MKGLKCNASNCELNNQGHCEAGIINISNTGVCKTKMRRHFDTIDNEYSKMEVAGEFDYADNDDVLIQCDSIKCKYNKDHICMANKVDIKDGVTRTKCVTRSLKK